MEREEAELRQMEELEVEMIAATAYFNALWDAGCSGS